MLHLGLRHRLASILTLGLLVPLLTVLGGSSVVPLQTVSSGTNPVYANGGVGNVSFYYDGTVPLTVDNEARLRSTLGSPSVVVTTPKHDEAGAVRAIHALGAKAYRYIQFYWAPNNASYEGINLRRHPGWAFCQGTGRSTHKVVGRRTADGARWFFIDANERAVRRAVFARLKTLRAEGWDGVMFDRGEAATQYATDIHGNPVWDRPSTCTADPANSRTRTPFATAFTSMLGLAHLAGLQAMVNNGKSPFDPVAPMRPNPRQPACRQHRWAACGHLSDEWPKLNLVLDETPAHPFLIDWARDFAANRASEHNAAHGHRTVALLTTASLGGVQRAPRVYYEWSRVKLFNLAVAVNTGSGGCGGGSNSGVCNRNGVYPGLASIRFGRPLRSEPMRHQCASHSAVRCVWVRGYAAGVNVLNAQGRARYQRISLGLARCRYVYNVYLHRPVAGNHCVRGFTVRVPAWGGRPLKYSTTPW